MAIADSSYYYILPKPFFRPTTKLKGRQPLPGTDPGHLDLKHLSPCHLTTVAITDSSYYFILPNPVLHPNNEAKRAPATGRDRSWPLRLQTPPCHLTTVPIAGSAYFSILPNPFLHPTTKLKGLLPLAGTDPGHSHFNQFVFTTRQLWQLLTAPTVIFCLSLFSALQRS